MLIPEEANHDLSEAVDKMGENMTPFFYILLALPQNMGVLEDIYQWLYSSFSTTDNPMAMIEAVQNVREAVAHMEAVKDHLSQAMKVLGGTSLGNKIKINREIAHAVSKRIQSRIDG